MSFLQRLWQKMRRPRGFIGHDLEGNSYLEYPNPNDIRGRPKRVVKYRAGYDMWTYVAGDKRLPIQWTSWMSHTRVHPPSLEELAADLERQGRVRLNAALIEARDIEERLQIIASASASASPSVTATSAAQQQVQSAHSAAPEYDQKAENWARGAGAGPITPKAPPEQPQPASQPLFNDEPQAWIPRAVQRGV